MNFITFFGKFTWLSHNLLNVVMHCIWLCWRQETQSGLGGSIGLHLERAYIHQSGQLSMYNWPHHQISTPCPNTGWRHALSVPIPPLKLPCLAIFTLNACHHGYDGYLGLDILAHWKATIDCRDNNISLHISQSLNNPSLVPVNKESRNDEREKKDAQQ